MTAAVSPSFEMGRLFHLVHVVDDIDTARRWYSDVFDALHVKRNDSPHRSGAFAVFADMIIEAMTPPAGEGAERSAVAVFRRRFGQRMHSVGMFADDLDALSVRLADHGFDVFDIAGNRVVGQAAVDATWVWTHPKQTRTVFEFARVPAYHYDPRLHRSYSGRYWRDEHPLGLVGTSHLTMLVRDLEGAPNLYGGAFGGTLIKREDVAGSHRSEFYTFGPDLDVEIRQPLDDRSEDGRQLADVGEGCFGITFEVSDLGRAVEHLLGLGLPLIDIAPGQVLVPPRAAFGMGIAFAAQENGDVS